jgi:hypothetical protein
MYEGGRPGGVKKDHETMQTDLALFFDIISLPSKHYGLSILDLNIFLTLNPYKQIGKLFYSRIPDL